MRAPFYWLACAHGDSATQFSKAVALIDKRWNPARVWAHAQTLHMKPELFVEILALPQLFQQLMYLQQTGPQDSPSAKEAYQLRIDRIQLILKQWGNHAAREKARKFLRDHGGLLPAQKAYLSLLQQSNSTTLLGPNQLTALLEFKEHKVAMPILRLAYRDFLQASVDQFKAATTKNGRPAAVESLAFFSDKLTTHRSVFNKIRPSGVENALAFDTSRQLARKRVGYIKTIVKIQAQAGLLGPRGREITLADLRVARSIAKEWRGFTFQHPSALSDPLTKIDLEAHKTFSGLYDQLLLLIAQRLEQIVQPKTNQ